MEVLAKNSRVQQEHLLVLCVSQSASTSIPPAPVMTRGRSSGFRVTPGGERCFEEQSCTGERPNAALLCCAGPALSSDRGLIPFRGTAEGWRRRGRAEKRRRHGQQPCKRVSPCLVRQRRIVQEIAMQIATGIRAADVPFFKRVFVCWR